MDNLAEEFSSADGRPLSLYFTVVFWGDEHREYFLRLCAPSLLAPGNIPALAHKQHSRFLICTTAQDWAQLESDPDFLALKAHIEPVWLEIPMPGEGDNKYLIMSSGHRMATEMAFHDRAQGVFITPDLVLADGGVVAIQRLAAAGKRVILCAALRYTVEGAVPEIMAMRANPGDPLVLPPRTLAAIALRNMHMETVRYDWDAACFAEMPHSVFWRVPGGDGIVIHGFNWAPLLADYATLDQHDTETFDGWTMDGDYVHRNFGGEEAIHIVRDSDEILLVSFTPAADRPGNLPEDALDPRWYNRVPVIGHFWKMARLRWMFHSETTDPLKRKNFHVPVRMHSSGTKAGKWAKAERRAADILQGAIADPGRLEAWCIRLVRFVQASNDWPFFLFHSAGSGTPPRVNTRLICQAGVGSHRAAIIGPPVTRGRWYWEVHSPNLGVLDGQLAETGAVGVVGSAHSTTLEIGGGRRGWGWRADGTRLDNGENLPFGDRLVKGAEVLMVAYDGDAGRLWVGCNGLWMDGGDPITGARPLLAGISGQVFPAMSSRHGGAGTAELWSRIEPGSWAYAAPEGYSGLVGAE